MQEQAERKKTLELREKVRQEKIEEEEKQKIEELAKLELQKNEEKLKKLQEAKEKAEERKKYLEGLKELKTVKKKKLLHEKLAEDYEKNVLIPESERITEAISNTRKSPVPSLEEIQSHIREYKKFLENKSMFKNSISFCESKQFTPSKFLQIVNDEEQMAKELEKIKEAEKLDLIERKKHYAKLVRQLYQPSIKENKIKIEQTPVKRRVFSMTPTLKKSEFEKPKINKSVNSPKSQRPKELPKINYLEQRREYRQKVAEGILDNFFDTFDDSLESKKIEEKTKKVEFVVKYYKNKEYNPETEEKLNTILIDSIKAKINALTKPNN